MKRKFSRLIAIVLVLSTLLMSAGPVAADDGSSVDWSDPVVLQSLYEKVRNAEDPDKAFAELSPQAQEALVESLTKLKYETTVTVDSSRGTKAVTVTVSAYSPFHILLWSYHQRIQWSYDGVYVTAVQAHYSWGAPNWPWRYDGLIGQSESGGAGSTYFQRFSQGKFTLYVLGLPIQSSYPWINQGVYGNGSHSYSGGS